MTSASPPGRDDAPSPSGRGDAPSPSGREDALARIVGDPGRFLAQRWGRRSHLFSGADVNGLLDVAQVDHIVSSMALRAPAFRVIKAGKTLPASTYTRRARIGSRTVTDLIDVGRVYGHFAEGATIVLQGLHRYWEPVTSLCRDLEQILTHPVQANAYITPPVAQGLRVHSDPHDVFAIQTHGRKQWMVYEGDQQPAPDGAGGEVTLDAQLWPGNCLYLPKGTHHAARTVDASSIHLTIGVRATSWADVLRRAVDAALDEPAFAAALPAGYATDTVALHEQTGQHLQTLAARLSATSPEQLLDSSAGAFWRRRAPRLTGQLQQLLAAGDIYDRTRVRRREDAPATARRSGDAVTLVLADRTVQMPASAASALEYVLGHDSFAVSDLAQYLDQEGRVTLVRRLVVEGLLLILDD